MFIEFIRVRQGGHRVNSCSLGSLCWGRFVHSDAPWESSGSIWFIRALPRGRPVPLASFVNA